ARIERATAVRDPEEGDVTVQRRGQRVGIEVRGAEQQSHPGSRLLHVIPERFHRRSTDHALLAPAGDESLARPCDTRQDAFELKEITPLRLGQGGASMHAELCDVESDLAQLAYYENLEVFRRELRQFGHRSTPGAE